MTRESLADGRSQADDPEATSPHGPRAADRSLLGLTAVPGIEGQFSVLVEPHLCRVDGRFYGGAALATAIASSEAASGRSALWFTTQLAGQAELRERIHVEVRSVAAGKTVTQMIVTGTVGDRLIFQALGATATPARQGMSDQWGSMPQIASPEDCESLADRIPASMSTVGHQLACEQRLAPPPKTGSTRSGASQHGPGSPAAGRPMNGRGLLQCSDIWPTSYRSPSARRPASPVPAPASTTRCEWASRSRATGCCSTSTRKSRSTASATATSESGHPTASCSQWEVRPLECSPTTTSWRGSKGDTHTDLEVTGKLGQRMLEGPS